MGQRSRPAIVFSAGVLLAALLAGFQTVQGEDCNANGIEDAEELRPGPLRLGDAVVRPLAGAPGELHWTDLGHDGDLDVILTACCSDDGALLTALVNDGGGPGESIVNSTLGGQLPRFTVFADLDGDGDDDVASTEHLGRVVRISLGDGTGAFAPPIERALGANQSRPWGLVAADLDGDGDLDLAASADIDTPGESVGELWVIPNLGDGSFGDARLHLLGGGVRGLVTADLDGDGRADLAMAADDSVSVVLQGADGQLGPAVDHVIGLSLGVEIIVADVDADGDADLVTTHLNFFGDSEALSVLLNDGLGGFSVASRLSGGSLPRATTVADIDADGAADILSGDANAGTFSVFYGHGDGTFEEPVALGDGAEPFPLAVADLDADGRLDVVTTDARGDAISVLLTSGTDDPRVFQPARRVGVGIEPSELLVGDIDLDGDPDLVVGNARSRDVTLLSNDGRGGFGADHSRTPPWRSAIGTRAVAADLDGDGLAELVTLVFVTDRERYVRIHPSSALDPLGEPLDLRRDNFPGQVLAADVDGDGATDLIVGRRQAHVLFNDGSGVIAEETFRETLDLPGVVERPAIADLDGDGVADLLTDDGWLVSGIAARTTRQSTRLLDGANGVVAADLDGDGANDVAAITGQHTTVLLADGSGSFQAAHRYLVAPGISSGSLHARDLDGDGDLDIVRHGPGAGVIVVHRNRGDGTFARRGDSFYGVGRGFELLDLDGDGVDDVVSAVSSPRGVVLFAGDGGGAFEAVGGIDLERSAAAVRTGDLDLDGQPDLVVMSSSGNGLSVFRNAGGFRFDEVPSVAVGSPADVGLADFDGDGRLDVATLRTGGATARVLLNGTVAALATDRDGNGRPDDCDPRLRRADANADGRLDISDSVFILSYLFLGGPEPTCLDAADVDDNGRLEITDGHLVNVVLFLGLSQTPIPSIQTLRECRVDATEDDLDCRVPNCP